LNRICALTAFPARSGTVTGINKNRHGKTLFLTAALCLAGLSASHLETTASNDGIEARLFSKIEASAKRGNIKDAKEDIQRVLKLNPRHVGATFCAGQYSFEEGNQNNAEKFFKRIENDQQYGAKARKYLAEMRSSGYRKKFQATLEILMSGESYLPALNLCEEAMNQNMENADTVFTATYLAAMLGMQAKSEKYSDRFSQLTGGNVTAAELKAFVDGWFSSQEHPESSLEKLLSLTDRKLLTIPVRKRIKDLIVSLKLIDKFETFIAREKKVPGADTGSLERELIGFLIDQKQYEKALDMINMRPVDSIDDNILYIKLLSLTNQEKKAMSTARQLLSSSPQDLRLYSAWIEAWLKFVERTQVPPEGADEGGKNFTEMADEILERLKPDKLVSLNPELLLNMFRMAFMTSNENQTKLIKAEVMRIAFNDELAEKIIKTVDELIIFNLSSIAVDLLESTRNQLPENYNLHIKLAEVHLVDNPQISATILENIVTEKPELLRAFLLWTESLNLTGKGSQAEQEILKRLEEPDLNDLVKRQLNAKLEVLRMQNLQDNPDLNPPKENEETENNSQNFNF
jgi:tetratricopeptide (TPR) repeat protein